MWGAGTFDEMNKVIPGTYIDIDVSGSPNFQLTDRGFLAVPMELPWGKDGEVMTVTAEQYANYAKEIFGYSYGSPELIYIDEIFKNANTAYIYRLNTGEKASGSIGKATCSGALGNSITVTVEADPELGTRPQELVDTSCEVTAETNKLTATYTGVPANYSIKGKFYKGTEEVAASKYSASTVDNTTTLTLVKNLESGEYKYVAGLTKEGEDTLYTITTATVTVTHTDATVSTVKLVKGSEADGTDKETEGFESTTVAFTSDNTSITATYTSLPEGYTVKGKIEKDGTDCSTNEHIQFTSTGTTIKYTIEKGVETEGTYTVKALATKSGEGDKELKTCTFTVTKVGEDKDEFVTASVSKQDKEDFSEPLPAGFIVHTYLEGIEVDSQNVETAGQLKDNSFVDFDPTVVLKEDAGIVFTGGTDGEADTEAHNNARNAFESYGFNILAVPSVDKEVQDAYISYTKRMRDEYGLKFQTLMPAIERETSVNYEGVIQYGNEISDAGYDPQTSLCYWLAGAEAGAAINESCMGKTYDGNFTVKADLTRLQMQEAIKGGILVFHRVGTDSVILKDINSLVSIKAQDQNRLNDDFKQNQTIRVIDGLATEFATIFNTEFLGKYANDEPGRAELRNKFIKVCQAYATRRAIQPFDEANLQINEGPTIRDVTGSVGFQVINAMEFLYLYLNVINNG